MHHKLKEISQNIGRCLRRDQHRLKCQYNKIQNNLKAGTNVISSFEELKNRIERSIQERGNRINSIPDFGFPELPVVEKRAEIEQAILSCQVVIICGETGSGKTTQLPKLCLSIGRGGDGFIGHTQPRRIAARSVALRIAQELGQDLGQAVGYKIRFHNKTRPEALIKLMTDGILLAEIQSDPYLDQYDTLIIDEAHERSLNVDFLLGYIKWLLPKRPDLKVIITSATFDPEKFSRHFADAPVIEVSGRTYPVEIRYRELTTSKSEKDMQQAIVDAVDELTDERQGDILVFLPSERDIRETAEALRKHHPEQSEILPLYSRLSALEQNRIFQPHKKLRIILATNIAETSLTVPGIRYVIDTGLARISRYSPRSKIQRLPIEKISKASAKQRAGRCGRLGPGVCIRLYSEEDFESRPEYTDPEIFRTNLASVILTMKSLKFGDIQSFPFIDPPDGRAIRDGFKLLHELNAIDSSDNLTALGVKLCRFPIDPRLGRMILAADKENCLSEILVIAAALSIQDPRERPLEYAQAADQCHARFKMDNSDFLGFLNLWGHCQEQKQHLSQRKFRNYCRQQFLSYFRISEWRDIHQQLLQLIKGELRMKPNQAPAGYDEIHRSILSGLLGNIGYKQESAEYLGARNQKLYIHPSSAQFRTKPRWIMSSELVETTRVYARNVAKIDPSWIEIVGSHLVKRNFYEPHWERKSARVAVYEQVILYGLKILSGRKVPFEKVNPVAAREIFIRSALVHQDYQTKAKFFKHNQELLEAMNYLQQKGRRADLMVDEELIYQFYDERIPGSVVNGITFDKWRKQKELKQAEILMLSGNYLAAETASQLDDNEYPDYFMLSDCKLRLDYCFEPGQENDGVTVIVPVHQLNQLEPEPFEWIVPGLLREKVISLIKALPKSIRKNLVPVPTYADRCLAKMDRKSASLHASLAAVLTRISGIKIDKSLWNNKDIETYLNVNYRLIDENEVKITESRDLLALKQKYREQAGEDFQLLASKHEIQYSGSIAWDFGELPENVQIKQHDQLLLGYPAIVDEGNSVGVRIFDTQAEAKLRHRYGLIRIFQIFLKKDIKYLKKNIKDSKDLLLIYSKVYDHPFLYPHNSTTDLHNELSMAALAAVFVDGQGDIRSKETFDERIRQRKPELIATAEKLSATVVQILTEYQNILSKLNSMPFNPLTEDIKEQLNLLIYRGFIVHTPYKTLIHIPRYLKAIDYRMEKSANNAQQEQSKLKELLPFWRQYWDSVKTDTSTNGTPPEFDQFRWGLEEFRVSLFAQILKTAFPVSAKRLEKAWRERTAS